jgi:hypothetical protein
VFGAYNTALWPALAALWVVTVGLVVNWMRKGRMDGRGVFVLLAVRWAWSGIVYHWFFFRSINQAATLFGAVFVLQAVLFGWLAAASRGVFTLQGWRLRSILGTALVVYGLVYPFVGIVFGLQYPRLPLFAVPCPTTLVTAGLLLTAVGVPRWVNIVPVLWSVLGISAAFALGIWADIALVVSGAILALDTLAPNVFGTRATA